MFISEERKAELLAKYNQLTEEEKDFFADQRKKEYVREDVITQCKDRGYELTEEQITDVVDRYVDDCDYDCELSYWDNLECLIEKVLED